MHGNCHAFFGVVRPLLVRHGSDYAHPNGGHTFQNVYTEMLYQICRDYSGLPDVRTLTAYEIRWFYDGLRAELKEHTKPKPK